MALLRLHILRHAKSSWSLPGTADIDRPLNDRGMADLPRIAAYMKNSGIQPDHIVCSPSTRTRMTLEGVKSGWEHEPNPCFDERLYTATANGYRRILGEMAFDGNSLMIIGHNPSCHELIFSLLDQNCDKNRPFLADIALKFPTGAMATIEFSCQSWADIGPGNSKITDLMFPRDL